MTRNSSLNSFNCSLLTPTIGYKRLTGKDFLMSFVFFAWLFCEMFFGHTIITQIALVAFCGLSFLFYFKTFCVKSAVSSKSFLFYSLFVSFVLLNIATGHAIDIELAKNMAITLILNVVFIFSFLLFCSGIGSIFTVLKLYRNAVVFFCAIILLLGFSSIGAGSRLSVLSQNANDISIMAANSLIITAYYYFAKKNRGLFSIVVPFLILLITIVLTGSRTGLVLSVIGIFVLLILSKKTKAIIYVVVFGIVIVGIVYISQNNQTLYNIFGSRIEAMFLKLKGETVTDQSLNTRTKLIEMAWEKSQDSLFWGHGINCFKAVSGVTRYYAHSNYLELLFGTGWTGVIIYYFPYAMFFFFAIKNIKKDNLLILPFSLLCGFLVCEYFCETYYIRSQLLIPIIILSFRDLKYKTF